MVAGRTGPGGYRPERGNTFPRSGHTRPERGNLIHSKCNFYNMFLSISALGPFPNAEPLLALLQTVSRVSKVPPWASLAPSWASWAPCWACLATLGASQAPFLGLIGSILGLFASFSGLLGSISGLSGFISKLVIQSNPICSARGEGWVGLGFARALAR
jgi:hypothetical protein